MLPRMDAACGGVPCPVLPLPVAHLAARNVLQNLAKKIAIRKIAGNLRKIEDGYGRKISKPYAKTIQNQPHKGHKLARLLSRNPPSLISFPSSKTANKTPLVQS